MKALTCGPSFSEVLSDFNDTIIYPVGCEEFVIIRISVKCHISTPLVNMMIMHN